MWSLHQDRLLALAFRQLPGPRAQKLYPWRLEMTVSAEADDAVAPLSSDNWWLSGSLDLGDLSLEGRKPDQIKNASRRSRVVRRL